jgi:hypothetical protein
MRRMSGYRRIEFVARELVDGRIEGGDFGCRLARLARSRFVRLCSIASAPACPAGHSGGPPPSISTVLRSATARTISITS